MNIEDRLREIIREELRPVLELLQSSPRSPAPSRPVTDPVPLADDADVREAFDVLKTDGQRAEYVAALPPIDPFRWLTTREAAGELGLRPRTLQNGRSAGKGPKFRKSGAAVRYDRADIERYIGNAEHVGTEPVVVSHGEPSEAAWKRAGEIAARILENLAIRDAEQASRRTGV